MPSDRPVSQPSQWLDEALQPDGLRPVFQPIVHLGSLEIVAHEGLSRPLVGPPGLTMPQLLDEARKLGRLAELELHAVRTICAAFAGRAEPGRLLVNLSAQAILQEGLHPEQVHAAMSASGLDLARVTLELTERDIVDNPGELAVSIAHLRARGVRVAMDDFGNGHSNFQMWNEVRPEVVKIDRYLVHGLATSAERLVIVQALCRVAETLGAELIGEGVEDPADLRMLCELGITYAQGYLLGRPSPQPAVRVAEAARVALRGQRVQVPPRPQGPLVQHTIKAGHLMGQAPALTPADTVAAAERLFAQQPHLHALAVTVEQRPIGLINRRVFTERMAKPYTRELFGRRSCALFMNEGPVLCDAQRSLESMAEILRGEDQRYLADGFVVTREGRYLGLGTGESLVRRVTELRIDAARHANPLTLLPGNIPVTEHLGRLLESAVPFVAAYVDLTDFKPFNDLYGYFRGDGMIRLLASILTEQVDSQADFVGHIGGDDFLLLMQSANWHERCHRMIEAFAHRSRALFDSPQLERGQLQGKDRHGARQSFPLTSVTVGAVALAPPFPARVEVIARLAARAKRHARRQGVPMHVIHTGGWLPAEQTSRLPA